MSNQDENDELLDDTAQKSTVNQSNANPPERIPTSRKLSFKASRPVAIQNRDGNGETNGKSIRDELVHRNIATTSPMLLNNLQQEGQLSERDGRAHTCKDSSDGTTGGTTSNGSATCTNPAIHLSSLVGSQIEASADRTAALISLQETVDKFSAQKLAANHRQKTLCIYIVTAVTISGLVLYLAAVAFHWADISRYGRWFLLAAPITTVMALKELSKKLARTRPVLARRLCSWLSFGNPVTICHLAALYTDTGNYQEGEKLLSKAAKSVKPANLPVYIGTHAYLATARARAGATVQADKLLQETMVAARTLHESRRTNVSASLLAATLNSGAEIEAQKQSYYQALAMSKEAVELLSGYTNPPLELLLSVLANAGHFNNAVGRHTEALIYLKKGKELVDQNEEVKSCTAAKILAQMGLALLKTDESAEAGNLLELAREMANAADGTKERPSVNRAIAQSLTIAGQSEEASEAYKLAIQTCRLQTPAVSYELLNLQHEYSRFLQKIGREGEAAAIELQSIQTKYDLAQINISDKSTKTEQIKPAAVQLAKVKSRFPVFSLIACCFYGWDVWIAGVRVAPFSTWVFFVAFATIVVLKLRAKYGPRSAEETSGAILSLVSHLPFARVVVPELAILPKKTICAILGTAIAVLGVVKISQPAPNTVPLSGLTAFEYRSLGKTLDREESFNKAREAFDHAISSDPNGSEAQHSQNSIRIHLPKFPQSDAAIEANMKALSLQRSNPSEATKIWQNCISQYPNFEYPYIHMSRVYLADIAKEQLKNLRAKIAQASQAKTRAKNGADDQVKDQSNAGAEKMDDIGMQSQSPNQLKAAESMVAKALEINPDNYEAQMAMSSIKSREGDEEAGQAYLKKALESSGTGQWETALLNSTMDMAKDLKAKRAKPHTKVDAPAN